MTTRSALWAAEDPNTSPPAATTALQLSSDTALSREGYFVLGWQPDASYASLQLQQATSAEFPDPLLRNVSATDRVTITGLVDGEYFYRLASGGQIVSNAVSVRVEHHSLLRALSFFLLGFLLFAVLLLSIFVGHRGREATRAG